MNESKTAGWIVFVAALGMLFTLMSADVKSLVSWEAMTTPAFIGTFLGHVAAVITAFVGGMLIPTKRGDNSGDKTRSTDAHSKRTDLPEEKK
jgi:hypothetical protein